MAALPFVLDDRPLILHAAETGNHELIQSLIKEGGADVNSADSLGETALMVAAEKACQTNNLATVDYLITTFLADTGRRDTRGCTAIMHAIDQSQLYDGWANVAIFLLMKHREMHGFGGLRDDLRRVGALHYACYHAKLELAKQLLLFLDVEDVNQRHEIPIRLPQFSPLFVPLTLSGTPFDFVMDSPVYTPPIYTPGLITLLLQYGSNQAYVINGFVHHGTAPNWTKKRNEAVRFFVDAIQPHRAFRDSIDRGVAQDACILHRLPAECVANIRGFGCPPTCTNASQQQYYMNIAIQPLRQLSGPSRKSSHVSVTWTQIGDLSTDDEESGYLSTDEEESGDW